MSHSESSLYPPGWKTISKFNCKWFAAAYDQSIAAISSPSVGQSADIFGVPMNGLLVSSVTAIWPASCKRSPGYFNCSKSIKMVPPSIRSPGKNVSVGKLFSTTDMWIELRKFTIRASSCGSVFTVLKLRIYLVWSAMVFGVLHVWHWVGVDAIGTKTGYRTWEYFSCSRKVFWPTVLRFYFIDHLLKKA